MQSLYDSASNQAILERLEKLSSQTQRLWGKMDVAQMFKHCQSPLKVALDELNLKRGILGFLLGSYAKKRFIKGKGFPKNLPTVPQFKIIETCNFEKEKTTLIDLIKRFKEGGAKKFEGKVHPFFGKMTAEEWDLLQWKHLDHHLQQFGV